MSVIGNFELSHTKSPHIQSIWLFRIWVKRIWPIDGLVKGMGVPGPWNEFHRRGCGTELSVSLVALVPVTQKGTGHCSL